MIIDMHIHPFCKEVHLGDDIEKIVDSLLGSNKQGRRRMQKLYEAMFNKISIDDYVSLMNKYGIDKAVIVSFNLTTAYGAVSYTHLTLPTTPYV